MFLSTFGPNAVSCSIILWVIVSLSWSWLSSVSYSSLQCPRQSWVQNIKLREARPVSSSPCGTPAHSWNWKVPHSGSRASACAWSCGPGGGQGWGNFYHRHCTSRPRHPSRSPPPLDWRAAGGWSRSAGSCRCRWRWRWRWGRPLLSTGSRSRRTSPSPHCRSTPALPPRSSPAPPLTPPHLPPHFETISCRNIWSSESSCFYQQQTSSAEYFGQKRPETQLACLAPSWRRWRWRWWWVATSVCRSTGTGRLMEREREADSSWWGERRDWTEPHIPPPPLTTVRLSSPHLNTEGQHTRTTAQYKTAFLSIGNNKRHQGKKHGNINSFKHTFPLLSSLVKHSDILSFPFPYYVSNQL